MLKKYRLTLLQIAVPLVAILFALTVGSLILLWIGKNPLAVYWTMFRFSFSRVDSVASILFKSTPLVFAGLAVALSFRVGLFNIGVEGQYQIGAFFAAVAGFALKGLPWFIHLPLVILCGMAGGVVWAWLPIYLKNRRGVHEVITTIMLNYVAFSLIHFFVADVFMDPDQGAKPGLGSPRVRMPLLEASARMPTVHAVLNPVLVAVFGKPLPQHIYLNWFFILGILLAIALYFVIWRTPFGYEIRATAQNPHASETAGINTRRVYFQAFLLSGAVAGLIGLSDLLSYFGYMDIDFPKGYGFTGIAVALLGKNDPLGVILAALLFGFLRRGAEGVQAFAGVPMEVISILEGVMILSIVVSYELLTRYVRVQKKKEAV